MKKLLCLLLTVIIICAVASVTARAADVSACIDASQTNFEGQTDFDYHIYSYYDVTIPTHIDVDSYGEVLVSMGYIEDGYHIEVYATNLEDDGTITVYSDKYETNGRTAKVGVLKDLFAECGSTFLDSTGFIGAYYPADYGEHDSASTTIGFTNERDGNALPGIYHGTICFRIDCVED